MTSFFHEEYQRLVMREEARRQAAKFEVLSTDVRRDLQKKILRVLTKRFGNDHAQVQHFTQQRDAYSGYELRQIAETHGVTWP